MKKFVCKVIAVVLLLGALTGVLSACKKEADTYSVSMVYKVSTWWPELDTLYDNLLNEDDGLTQENPYTLLNIDGCPSIQLSMRFIITNKNTDKKTYVRPLEEYDATWGTYFCGYYIQTDNKNWVQSDLSHDVYDERQLGAQIDYENCFQLQRVAGMHRLKFRCPNNPPWDNPIQDFSENAYFTLDINIKGDTRESVTLRAENSDDYTKLTNIDGRDLFIMKYGVSTSNKYLPLIGVYNQKNEVVLNPMFPTVFHDETPVPHIKSWISKVNELYPYLDLQDNLPSYYPTTSGVYLASFTYTGDETYQPTEYLCYVVIPE